MRYGLLLVIMASSCMQASKVRLRELVHHDVSFSPDICIAASAHQGGSKECMNEVKMKSEEKALHEFGPKFPRELFHIASSYSDTKSMFPRLYDANLKSTHKLSHSQPILGAVFNNDGNKIATTSIDKRARIWDAKTGKLLHEFMHNTGAGRAVFSPDASKLLVFESLGDRAGLWDIQSGRGWDTNGIGNIEFNFDGTQLVAEKSVKGQKTLDMKSERDIKYGHELGDNGSHIERRIFDATSGVELPESDYRGPKAFQPDVHFSFDGRRTIDWKGNQDNYSVTLQESTVNMSSLNKNQIMFLWLLEKRIEEQAGIREETLIPGHFSLQYVTYYEVSLADVAKAEHIDIEELRKTFFSFEGHMQEKIRNAYGIPDMPSILPYITASYKINWRKPLLAAVATIGLNIGKWLCFE